ncbi:hypothetical protein LMG24238_06942 [Paraburkholderia sediminicola]|uniref:Uncharacterized protein n=1 Tax=Paraburkholderia sediminicola TaxID=458836 RepID=A0A6J5CS13_9BURK|nr:hypothetical protein [Paraburkholderia sediminicola]CAB3742796.1 hypothetical protein LMG24238_06942 [Paraburkholderia sediminicola]
MPDIVELAREAGLTVVLNGRIGQQEYHSVTGPISALQRFAEAYRTAAEHDEDKAKND